VIIIRPVIKIGLKYYLRRDYAHLQRTIGALPVDVAAEAAHELWANEGERMGAAAAERRTFKPERMLAFSDAVMAVAITLLVLDLKLPEGVRDAGLGPALREALPNMGAYALSFVVIGLLWIGHHEQFSHIRRVDGALIWLNLFFLLTIGLIPFVTSVLSDHGTALATTL
jgi:hypothetical protein